MQSDFSGYLGNLGWSPFFHQQFLALCAQNESFSKSVVARITAEQRGEFGAFDGNINYRAVLAGRLRHNADDDPPCVGDFVLLNVATGDLARIEYRFERKSLFRRKIAGAESRAQAIAANVDIAFVVCALTSPDSDPQAARHSLSARRIERYLHAIRSAPADPIVLLNKADLSSDADERALELTRELHGVEVVAVSAHSETGLDLVRERIGNSTAVLVGSSGVGKSSITNRLLGSSSQRVQNVRSSDTRGRHTTTHRELFLLPSGGLLIDTPGMREFGLFADAESELKKSSGFDEIDTLAERCHYRDCRHIGEPGCAVLEAVESGQLSASRVEHAARLRRELEWQQTRNDQRQRAAQRKAFRALSRAVREGQELKRRK